MTEEISEYQLFRLQKLQGDLEDDNNSAHFSMKQSLPDFTDRPLINSARSSPNQNWENIQNQLTFQMKQNQELSLRNQELQKKYRLLQQKFEQMSKILQRSENQNNRIKGQLENRLNKQKQTKGQLKQWVVEAKKNLGKE